MEVVDKKISDTSGLISTTVLNTKISEVENKIPDTSNLVTATVLNVRTCEVENGIPNHIYIYIYIYITTPEFDKLTAENFTD